MSERGVDLGRIIEESLPENRNKGDKPVDTPDMGLTFPERFGKKNEPISPQERKVERDASSLDADYALLRAVSPQFAEKAKDDFKKKIIATVLETGATPELEEKLRKQDDIWKLLDTFLKGPAAGDVVVKQLTKKLRERTGGITSSGDKKSKY